MSTTSNGWLSAISEQVAPGAYCTCGHQKRYHYGQSNEGACLGAHRNEKGKELDGTVCPCVTFKAKFETE